MGTRHLIAVQVDGEYKVAQYGQWDGYPSGQGANILEFLHNHKEKLSAFADAVRACSEMSDEDYKQAWVDCGADPDSDLVTTDISRKFRERYPHLSRNCGADILNHVFNAGKDGLKLRYALDFAADSLFCEWAYVIDLDKNTFEVFKGFNTTPLDPSERFASLPVVPDNTGSQYYQVKLVQSYDLDKLPSVKEFVSTLEKEE